MARQNAKAMLVRQWRLIELVRSNRQGKFIKSLMEELEVSKATLYRDLGVLEEAGLPITRQLSTGEARVVYMGDTVPPRWPHRSGNRMTNEVSAHAGTNTPVQTPPLDTERNSPAVLASLEEAIVDQLEVHISYRAPGTPGTVSRIIAPLRVHHVRESPYLLAWEPVGKDWRLLEVARITEARLGAYQDEMPPYDPEELFAYLVESRLGQLITVAVRLAPAVAGLANEYPLTPDQLVEPQPDGSVMVRSQLVGTHEALRWVLSWGRQAEVIEPEELNKQVADELNATLSAFTR